MLCLVTLLFWCWCTVVACWGSAGVVWLLFCLRRVALICLCFLVALLRWGFVGVGLFVLFLLLVDYCGYLWAAGFSW